MSINISKIRKRLALRRRFNEYASRGIAVALFGVLLISLLVTSNALQNSTHFQHLYTFMLVVNVLAVIALIALIALNLRQLVRQIRKRRMGARLTLRLVGLLVILSSVPVILVYYFSLQFLHQRLDSWFDVNIERALTDALELSRASLDARMRDTLKQTETVAAELALINNELVTGLPATNSSNGIAIQLNELRNTSGAAELTLLATNGQIIASTSVDTGQLLPSRPSSDSTLLQLKQSPSYVNLEPIANRGWYIRVTIKLMQGNNPRLLHALFPIAERIGQLANNVESAIAIYKERTYLQAPLKLSFTLVLSLVLLLSIFSTVWMAFFAVHRLVAPLSNLVEGTKAVASGDYDKQLPVEHLDELGFLVQSFNEMTRNIALARNEVEHSQQLADNQRFYLQAVLGRLSSGVISLDHAQRLRTTNPAADQILGLPLSDLLGQTLHQLQLDHPSLHSLYLAIHAHLSSNTEDWREEITLFGSSGRKILMCRGTQLLPALPLPELVEGGKSQESGHVIVFDDVTTLIQAQRDAAWSEVARRLAHEIKNPLTPIQLSAERLRQKYLHTLPEKDVGTLDRMTHTIIQQVEAMKEMVNAFSDYARNPTMRWQYLDLNQLIKEVLELYHDPQTVITMHLAENIPTIQADRGRLRQVLHNLLKNALEANPVNTHITVTTQHLAESTFDCVELRIQDQGTGVPAELLNQIFEPYVTSKTKGTGLGLAIVKKIIDEHGGMVWLDNPTDSSTVGACVVIRLPIATQPMNEPVTLIE